jgi:hypothetical protein
MKPETAPPSEHALYKTFALKYGITWKGRHYGTIDWGLSAPVEHAIKTAHEFGFSTEDAFAVLSYTAKDEPIENRFRAIRWAAEHQAEIEAFNVEQRRLGSREAQNAALASAGYGWEVIGHHYVDGFTANVSHPHLQEYEADMMPLWKVRTPDGRLVSGNDALIEIGWWEHLLPTPRNPFAWPAHLNTGLP